MPGLKLYVKAKSKADLNRRLAAGEVITGQDYSMFDNRGTLALDSNLAPGTVIAVYQKTFGGDPYTRAWGTWDGKKVR